MRASTRRPRASSEEQAVNAGGVNIRLYVTYFSDYVFRGIDRSETGGNEDSTNLQFDGALRFDLGQFPDLFLGVFTNVNNSDPVSRFQEIRPYIGLELTARPIHPHLRQHVLHLPRPRSVQHRRGVAQAQAR